MLTTATVNNSNSSGAATKQADVLVLPTTLVTSSYSFSISSDEELYSQHATWFRNQRKQLATFLELTANIPHRGLGQRERAEFPLVLPALAPITSNRPVKSSVCFSRQQVLDMMTGYIEKVYLAEQREREQLVRQASKTTRLRWRRKAAAARQGLTANTLGKTNKLPVATRQLLLVFGCLVAGRTNTKEIANQIDRTYSPAQMYRQYLLDAVLFCALRMAQAGQVPGVHKRGQASFSLTA